MQKVVHKLPFLQNLLVLFHLFDMIQCQIYAYHLTIFNLTLPGCVCSGYQQKSVSQDQIPPKFIASTFTLWESMNQLLLFLAMG